MNFNNHNDFLNQSASILLRMKQSNHNDLPKQYPVLSDSERATFLTEFDATSSFKKLLVKPKVLKPFKKRKVDEDVYQVERVLSMRKQKGKLEFEIKWLGYEETTWEPKTNLQGEACKFLLDCIFQFLLHTYTHLVTVSVQEAISLEEMVSQKAKFVTFLLIDMIKLTIIVKFQNLMRKHKKQKIVPKVKSLNNLLMLVLSKWRNWSLNFLLR